MFGRYSTVGTITLMFLVTILVTLLITLLVTLLITLFFTLSIVIVFTNKKLQYPPKVVECVGPSTECIFTLIRGAKTPPLQRQEEQKESILAALLYVLPVQDYGVLGWILAK